MSTIDYSRCQLTITGGTEVITATRDSWAWQDTRSMPKMPQAQGAFFDSEIQGVHLQRFPKIGMLYTLPLMLYPDSQLGQILLKIMKGEASYELGDYMEWRAPIKNGGAAESFNATRPAPLNIQLADNNVVTADLEAVVVLLV